MKPQEPTCDVPWPVCPHCLGEPLQVSAGECWCVLCERRFLATEREPCSDAATVTVVEVVTGAQHHVCRSHGVRATQLHDSRVEGLSAEDWAAARALPGRDEASRVARGHEPMEAGMIPGHRVH